MAINLPVGTAVKTNVELITVDFLALIFELKRKLFNGYLCLCIQGKEGIEEGTLVFDAGKIVASFYEYFKYNKVILGDKAFVRVMNASAAKNGVIDIYQLSNEQVQLILAFNEQAISIPSDSDLRRLKTEKFSDSFENEVKAELNIPQNKTDVLKKYKISGIQ